jgi:hypothetical protein
MDGVFLHIFSRQRLLAKSDLEKSQAARVIGLREWHSAERMAHSERTLITGH